MPAGPWKAYPKGLANYLTDANMVGSPPSPLRLVLLGPGYMVIQSAHSMWAEASGSEVVGPGYTANGKGLTSINVTFSGSTFTLNVGPDQSWGGATLTAKYAAIVQDRNNDGVLAATDVMLCYCELNVGGDVSVDNGTLTIDFPAGGAILNFVCS